MIKVTSKHKKSRNGAEHQCAHCGKKLRGEKGLKMHVRQEHEEAGKAVAK
ncbi:hypothetical protein [Martelella mediterranea]|uniref:C2H2-type domain-containing protein n=1 Tax=Martelella mediterranea TaxID=293089 RepID=A0A4R3NUX3_9HYPH|nr:hypothetical protein [Martelella mediterranea]TCT41177.1 hypothetical protein EDC90_1007154 [Martelella mediterranea]